MEEKGLSESRFNMWRAVVAMVHADTVVKPHEIHFILNSTKDLPLTAEQRQALVDDIATPSDIQTFFHKITSPRDKVDFFQLARAVSWADGDMDEREEAMLSHMKALHLKDEDRRLLSQSFGLPQRLGQAANESGGLIGKIKTLLAS